ncbi:hypothetical protein VZT92_004874 [Zoarces viviparus]|uniref:Uncharacterized protein n=1 Tax=Zoarces viviparus TaxID=48416 RepID=A0AAW1FR03_ZOAVI
MFLRHRVHESEPETVTPRASAVADTVQKRRSFKDKRPEDMRHKPVWSEEKDEQWWSSRGDEEIQRLKEVKD